MQEVANGLYLQKNSIAMFFEKFWLWMPPSILPTNSIVSLKFSNYTPGWSKAGLGIELDNFWKQITYSTMYPALNE